MGQVKTLGDVVRQIGELDPEATIYAAEPWTEQSLVYVAREPDVGGVPEQAQQGNLSYFLEVNIANDFIEDWRGTELGEVDDQAACKRLIQYATHDA